MKALWWMGSLCMILGLAACQSSTPNRIEKVHHYTEKQKCPTLLVMKVGEVLQFTAPENPSTGYVWQLVQPLKLFKTEETFLQPETDKPVVGMGGEKSFSFRAEKPGQELIELVHVRPWESNKEPSEQWLCRVRIS